MPIDITLVGSQAFLPPINPGEANLHTITCAVFNGTGEVLILVRHDGKNELVGEHVEESDRSALEAARRGLLEEIGLDIPYAWFTLRALSRYGVNKEKTNWIFFCQLQNYVPIEQILSHLPTPEHQSAFWISAIGAKGGILLCDAHRHHEILTAIPF